MIPAAYGRHVNSNPITIAAIKRQREKEWLRLNPPSPSNVRESERDELQHLRRQVAELKFREEQRHWHDEFQANIMRLKLTSELFPEEFTAEVKVTAKGIMQQVAAEYGYTMMQLIRKDRHRPLVKARMEAVKRIYQQCPHLSLPQIGRLFGGRDHTTILHYVKKAGVHVSQRDTRPFPSKKAA